MSKAIENDSDEADNRSPAQVIPRHVDTSLKFNGYPVKKYAIGFSPAILCVLAGLVTVAVSGPALLAFAFIVVFAPVALVLGGWVVIKSDWHTPPRERLRNWRRHRRLRRSMPWNYSETIAHDLAGLAEIYDDGAGRMSDGRVVGLAGISGRSTDRMTDHAENEAVNSLGGAIDEKIKNFAFRFYTTTLHTAEDTDDLTEPYQQAARSTRFQSDVWAYVRAICNRLVRWRRTVDAPAWDAPERRHYIMVEATADDARSLPSPTLLDRVSPFRTSQEVTERQHRRAAKRELLDRLSKVEGAIGSVEGLSAERISPDEHAQLLLNYWTGEHHATDEELERAFRREHTGPTVWPSARAQSTPDSGAPVPADERKDIGEDTDEGTGSRAPGNRSARERLFGLFDSASSSDEANASESVTGDDAGLSPDGETSAQRLLAPGIYDVTRDAVRVGDQLCRTYWIAEWPTEPDSLYWKPIYTLFGAELDGDLDPEKDTPVDLDVSIHVEPEDRDTVMAELAKQWGSIGAEGVQRSEDGGDVTALGVSADQDAYTQMYELLRTTNVQPWRVSAYVTVRAGQKQAIEQFEDTLRDYASLDAAKQDALRVRCEQITDLLDAAPTNCTPVMAGDLHHAAFEAGSPTGRNAFAQIGRRDLKTQWMLGDAVAALFPPCSDTIQEEGGIEWGRNEQDGQVLKADPWKRGLAPHIITIGTSRSGKSYSAQKVCQRWYPEREDRTLIALDTQGEFDGLTKALDGKHIVLGGQDAVNPFHTEAPPEHANHAGGQMSPFTMKVDSIVQFIKAIVRSQGRDPAPFHNTIEQLVRQTLIEAGADPNNPATLAEADATMRDFIELSGEVMDEPSVLTLGTHEKEIGNKTETIAALRDALGGFMEGQKYEYLLDEDATGLMDDDVDMAYLDLRQFRDSGAAEKSAMFRLMLDQVNQKVKRTPGKTIFLIDEAHFLLHSEEMVNWLQKAAREWARYDACLWFCSQSPRGFIAQTTGGDGENKRRTIYEQCSTVQFFRTSGLSNDDEQDDILPKFGLNDTQVEFIKKRATPGWSEDDDYSQSLIQFDDRPESWFPLHVEASPVEDAICDYTPREHGDFGAYMEAKCGIEPPEERGYTPPPVAVPVVPGPDGVDEGASPATTGTPTASADGGRMVETDGANGTPATAVTDIGGNDTDGVRTNGSSTDTAHDLLAMDPSALGERPATTSDGTSVEGEREPTPNETDDGGDWVADVPLFDARDEQEANSAGTSASDQQEEEDKREQGTEREQENEQEQDREGDDQKQARETDQQPRTRHEDGQTTTEEDGEEQSQSRSSSSEGELSLTDLDSVGEDRAEAFRAAGYDTVADVFNSDRETLLEVEGVGPSRVTTIHGSAEYLLHETESHASSETPVSASETTDTGAETDAEPEIETDQEQATAPNASDDNPTATVEFAPESEQAQDAGDSDGDDASTRESEEKQTGYWDRVKETISSPFAHPAAGKDQPALTDIGIVDERKAVALRAAGYETVTAVYTAERTALAAVEGVDETHAGAIQSQAERTLIASDAPVPAPTAETEENGCEAVESAESTESAVEDTQPPDSPTVAESAERNDTADESHLDKDGDGADQDRDHRQPILTDIQQVGKDRADVLRGAGYESVASVAAAERDELTDVESIGGARAETIAESADDLLATQADDVAADVAGGDE